MSVQVFFEKSVVLKRSRSLYVSNGQVRMLALIYN
jgi:hypothetical protein